MHAVNNGLIGTLAQRPALAAWFGMDTASGDLPWTPVLAGTAVMAAALARAVVDDHAAARRAPSATTPAPVAPAPTPP